MDRMSCGHPKAFVALNVTSMGKFHTRLASGLRDGAVRRATACQERGARIVRQR